jgi:two-component system response regulator RegX3
MVSAKSSEMDTVVGLEVGADDYVAKPYRMFELIARIRAVIRRKNETEFSSVKHKRLEANEIELDPETYEVKIKGRKVIFTVKEFDLLEALMVSAGKVVLREKLIDKVWGPNFYGSSKTLDVHIRSIRKKLQENGSTENRISTVRGLGYRFEID